MRSQLRDEACPLARRVGTFASALKMKKSWHGETEEGRTNAWFGVGVGGECHRVETLFLGFPFDLAFTCGGPGSFLEFSSCSLSPLNAAARDHDVVRS